MEIWRNIIYLRHILCLALFRPVMSETLRQQYRQFSDVTLAAVTTTSTITTSTGCCNLCTTKSTCVSVRYDTSSQVCEMGPSTLLISPFTNSQSQIVYASGSSIYELVKIMMTWNSADNNCKEKGGQLVKVGTSQEHDQLMAWLKSFGHNQDTSSDYGPWIGLNDHSREGSFTWADGSAFDGFTNWGENQPDDYENEDCVNILFSHSTWNDFTCEEPFWSVCEYN